MQRLLTIFLSMLLMLPAASAGVAVSLPKYIRIIGEHDTLPFVSDDELLRNGVPVRFKVNKTNISPADSGYLTLRHALLNIPRGYRFCRLLVLRGSASPEGPALNNKRLAHQRARALADSLRRYVTLPDSTIEERFINEDYAGLYKMVEASDMPYRSEVLSIIDFAQDDATIKRRLQTLDRGRAWKVLLRDFFPKLRATRVIMVISREPVDIRPLPVTVPGPTTDTVPAPRPVARRSVFKPWIAVKSNLLYDAAMTPNVEVERWFGKDDAWSVMAEWNFPWWQWHRKERVYEVNEFGLELRRWLGGRGKYNPLAVGGVDEYRPLVGHFLGLYAAGGYYDLEWRYHGEQGDIYSAGLTYGYAMRLARHWNMEFSLSVGYLYSPYTHFEAENGDDILFAKYRKHFNYVGPTKLKVSLVWLIGKTKRQ